jgi:hypothetical protein
VTRAGEWAEINQVYDNVGNALREAGLMRRRVFDTPGWQAAVEVVTKRCDGWTMGPIARDTWDNWLHILSHSVEGDHGIAHAKFERELAELAIATLAAHR